MLTYNISLLVFLRETFTTVGLIPVRLKSKLDEKGLTIVPIKLYPNEDGIYKIQIGLAKGRKVKDKKEYIQERDTKRELKAIIG